MRKRLSIWLLGMIFSGILLFLITGMVAQFANPPVPHRLLLVQDIPLPGVFPDAHRTPQNPTAPGLAVLFDHFDFQALDPQTHLLFIAHTGPNPDRERQVNPNFNPETDVETDGNIVIFDTVQNKVVGLLNIPQVAGIVVADNLHKVYAADSNDSIIYDIDEQTFKTTPIQLQTNDSPDALEYDEIDHLIFVSDPGAPANPDQSLVVERKNQNETIIDALTDKVITRIPLGVDGKWGDDVGHVRFDPGLHRAFVTVQQLPNPDDPNPRVLPPPGTARLVAFDPLTHQVLTRLNLPRSCSTPHGMALDTTQHIAFIACIDTANLIRVDLRTMKIIQEPSWPLAENPDMLVIDHPLHLLYVACGTGIVIFQIEGRALKWLGTYTLGINTHTLAVNEQTHEIYLPIARIGNRPVLRIMRYNPNGQ